MRAVVDHHVDRPDVEAQQCVKLTGTNPSIGLIQPGIRHRAQSPKPEVTNIRYQTTDNRRQNKNCHLFWRLARFALPARLSSKTRPLQRPGGYGEGPNTRSHPELGRENPQRRWYCVLRRGRVGRRQVFEAGVKPNQCRQKNRPLSPHTRGVEQPGSSSGS